MQKMSDNSTNPNLQYRFASIQTLGFLSEFLEQYINKELTNDQVGQILHATICNIDPTMPDLTEIAI